MNQQYLMRIILSPQVSEKSTFVNKNNQLIFKVINKATKKDVKMAVEFLFKVAVKSVQILNVKRKIKRFGQKEGVRKGWKKAFVALETGQKINFIENGSF